MPQHIVIDGNTCGFNSQHMQFTQPWRMTDVMEDYIILDKRNVFTNSMASLRRLVNDFSCTGTIV